MITRLVSISLAALWCALPLPASADEVAASEAASAGDERRPTTAGIPGDAPVPTAAIARAVRRTAAVSIDGRLDDPGWKHAPVNGGFVQRFPHEGRPPDHATEFQVLYDDQAIYVAVRAFDPDPAEVRGLLTRRDVQSSSDWILVGLDSYHDRRTAFVFGVNPAGVQLDRLIFNDHEEDGSWDAVWTSAAGVDEHGWTAELRIPLSQLRFSAKPRQAWGLQIVRQVARTGEQSSWSPWPRAGAQVVSSFGVLDDIEGLSPGRRLEVLPYVTGGVALVEADAADPFTSDVGGRWGAGVDVRYGLSSAFTLAATINPDFGQVEADPSQVNLTAHETFFPEKRPFFLEGIDIFRYSLQQGDGGGGEGLFYTRRIGRVPTLHGLDHATYADTPRETTIYGAAKVSGKTDGGWSIGVLEAVTAEETARLEGAADPTMRTLAVEPLTNYALATTRKDFRGGNSTVAGVVTAVHRRLDTPELRATLHDQAYTGGTEVHHRFWKNEWSTTIKAYGSWVHGSTDAIAADQLVVRHLYQRPDAPHLEFDPTRTSLSGAGLQWDVGRWNHKRWNFGTGGDARTPGLEVNDMGFQHGADFVAQWIWVGFRDDQPSEHVLNWGTNTDVWAGTDFEPRLANVGANVNGFVTLANYWNLNGGVNTNRNYWDMAALRGGPRVRSEHGYNAWATVNTDGRKKVNGGANAWVNRRPASDSWGEGINLWFAVQARSNIELVLGPSFDVRKEDRQYITEVVDAEMQPRYILGRIHQVTTSMTVRGSWTFSPRLSLQLYAQPFVAAGAYGELKEAAAERTGDGYGTYAPRYQDRYRTFGRDQLDLVEGDGDPYYAVDADGDGAADFTFGKPDFNVRAFNSNVVLRWEYRPGSTVFFIWSHARGSFENQGEFDPGHDLGALAGQRGEDVVMIKANYWVGL